MLVTRSPALSTGADHRLGHAFARSPINHGAAKACAATGDPAEVRDMRSAKHSR